jgi:hypothetical protein
MQHKINKILLNSENTAQEIEQLIVTESKKRENKIHLFWGFILTFFLIACICVIEHNKPSREQILGICTPIVDSMQSRYQAKLDFIVDSLDTNYYKHLKK